MHQLSTDKLQWPPRFTELNIEIAEAMNNGPLVDVETDPTVTRVLLGETHDSLEGQYPLEYKYAETAGLGVVRASQWTSEDAPQSQRIEFHQWANKSDAQAALAMWRAYADGAIDTIELEEVLVPSVYLIDPPPDAPKLGLAIVLNGYGPTRHFMGGAEELRERGWFIMMVPSISLGIAMANLPTPVVERYDFEDGPAWFATQFTNVESASYGQVNHEEIGRLIAQVHDERIAMTVYTIEAALEYLARHRPDVPQEPKLLLAISLGALMAPATVSRIGKVDVAVIVTGAANLFGVVKESVYELATQLMGSVTRVTYPDEVEVVYLLNSQLDPWNTIDVLRDTPVIMIQSNNDNAVPSQYSELLWEMLGRPERLQSDLNHFGVLASLSWHMAYLADWVEAQLNEPPVAPGHEDDSS